MKSLFALGSSTSLSMLARTKTEKFIVSGQTMMSPSDRGLRVSQFLNIFFGIGSREKNFCQLNCSLSVSDKVFGIRNFVLLLC